MSLQTKCPRWLAAALLAAMLHPLPAALAQSSSDRGATPIEIGTASFYGAKWQGKKTASGQRFNDHKLTAASRTLPLHSKAKVINLRTGRSVKVTINDRGPYRRNRVIDLSAAAARKIGVTKKNGVAPVEVKPLKQQAQAFASH